MRFTPVLLLSAALAACSSSSESPSGSTSGGTGAGGSGPSVACETTFDDDTLHIAAGAEVPPGVDTTMCMRWTAPEAIDISGFVGVLGSIGHHALLLASAGADEPDGLAPCSELEIMDAQKYGSFQMLAGVSYESSGQRIDFPSAPVQIGLHVDKGTQLVLDAHFLNTSDKEVDGCASIDLSRGKPVIAKLLFRTVLPETEYALTVPAHGSFDGAFEEPTGGDFRVAAASSHMHAGGTHFRMSIKETDTTIYESTTWAEPTPATFGATKLLLGKDQTLKLECTFENGGASDQHFPAQMCVGGMYLLPCSFPGAC